MVAKGSRRSTLEIGQIGQDLFERQIRPLLEPADDGKLVAIDVDTGAYEIDADDYAAVARLRAKAAQAEVWLARAGSPTTYRI